MRLTSLPTLTHALLALAALSVLSVSTACATERYVFGTIQSDPARAPAQVQQGIRAVQVGINWARLEPQPGQINAEYVQQMRERLHRFRDAGALILLDMGMHYTPAWVFDLPHSRYVNQYGQAYADPGIGMAMLNGVFNQRVREAQQRHMTNVFEQFGTDFHAVRLGWGQYGELCYPRARYEGNRNSFWAYDAVAQGQAEGLPQGVPPCPVPGWQPGQASANHASARAFAQWYLDALVNYQNWQIDVVRQHYHGRLMMLYPSWGLRPGIVAELIRQDLASDTQEIQRGVDYQRLVAALNDPKVVVYCTWMDGNNQWVDDASSDARAWSPMRYLAHLAHEHPLKLAAWGENSATPSNAQAMALCFERMRQYDIEGLMWAFERNLYDDSGRFASLQQYVELIEQLQNHDGQ